MRGLRVSLVSLLAGFWDGGFEFLLVISFGVVRVR